LTAAETGLLLLCCALPEAEDRPLTMAQFQELAKRARALGPGGENPLRELTARDLERLGYSQEQCGRIVRLLSRETQLERYLRAAERNGIVPITRLSPRYPARLRRRSASGARRCCSRRGMKRCLPRAASLSSARGS